MATDDARVHVLRLDAIAQAISAGVLVGLGIFAATNWLVLKGGDVVGPNLALLAQFCPGYRVSFLGSLIGFAYGLFYGGLAGWAVGTLYNRVLDARRA
jgi:hypothetical protein